MRTEPRYQRLFHVADIAEDQCEELASALCDPYTVIRDLKSGDTYITWDREREQEMAGDNESDNE